MRSDMPLGATVPRTLKCNKVLHLSPRVVHLQVSVPSFFLCPISLELMRDPVALSTGMTYDRMNIEKWFESGHNTCPATNQVVDDQELIPNHTLRRLIQDWCVANKGYGVERIPTPKQPVGSEEVRQLLHSIVKSYTPHASLTKLHNMAKESERNRRFIAEAGAVSILAAVLGTLSVNATESSRSRDLVEACEEAISTVAVLQLSDGDEKVLASPRTLSSLCWLLTSGSVEAKANAAEVLHSLCEADAFLRGTVGSVAGVIKGLVHLVEEDIYSRAVYAGLKCLLSLCILRKNRIVAIECNAISSIVELLPNADKRNTERAFALLEILANCAEGREAISNHALAIPIIVKSLLGMSDMATEHAVATLWVVLSFASNRNVINSALQAGAMAKLLMLLPSNCSQRSKQKAHDSLKILYGIGCDYTYRPADASEIRTIRELDQIRPSPTLL